MLNHEIAKMLNRNVKIRRKIFTHVNREKRGIRNQALTSNIHFMEFQKMLSHKIRKRTGQACQIMEFAKMLNSQSWNLQNVKLSIMKSWNSKKC